MFSIGEFSRITGMPVKTIRFYHEAELLLPASVDPETGYRYYDQGNAEKARVILRLRQMELSISDIKALLENYDDDAQILAYLEEHRQAIEAKIERLQNVTLSLDQIIRKEREAQMISDQSNQQIVEKQIEEQRIAGITMQGKYSDCGKSFGALFKNLGRYVNGKPFCLHHDGEYREDDAHFDVCVPVKSEKQVEGVFYRKLPACRCVCLTHQGPYETLGRPYQRVLEYIKTQGYGTQLPTREVYIKGPGMIFKGNPKKYLTEIQIPIA